jgi:hypothetical protein
MVGVTNLHIVHRTLWKAAAYAATTAATAAVGQSLFYLSSYE